MSEPTGPTPSSAEREAVSLAMIGGFFVVLASLVLVGTFWARHRPHAMYVNLGAGLVLLLIGVVMLWGGRLVQRRLQGPR